MYTDNLSTVAPPTKRLEDEDIFDVLGAGDIPDEEKGLLLGKMVELIERRTLERILDSLDEDTAKHLEKDVLDKEDNDPDALQKFLDIYVPNYQDMFNAEARSLRQELIQKVVI